MIFLKTTRLWKSLFPSYSPIRQNMMLWTRKVCKISQQWQCTYLINDQHSILSLVIAFSIHKKKNSWVNSVVTSSYKIFLSIHDVLSWLFFWEIYNYFTQDWTGTKKLSILIFILCGFCGIRCGFLFLPVPLISCF